MKLLFALWSCSGGEAPREKPQTEEVWPFPAVRTGPTRGTGRPLEFEVPLEGSPLRVRLGSSLGQLRVSTRLTNRGEGAIEALQVEIRLLDAQGEPLWRGPLWVAGPKVKAIGPTGPLNTTDSAAANLYLDVGEVGGDPGVVEAIQVRLVDSVRVDARGARRRARVVDPSGQFAQLGLRLQEYITCNVPPRVEVVQKLQDRRPLCAGEVVIQNTGERPVGVVTLVARPPKRPPFTIRAVGSIVLPLAPGESRPLYIEQRFQSLPEGPWTFEVKNVVQRGAQLVPVEQR